MSSSVTESKLSFAQQTPTRSENSKGIQPRKNRPISGVLTVVPTPDLERPNQGSLKTVVLQMLRNSYAVSLRS